MADTINPTGWVVTATATAATATALKAAPSAPASGLSPKKHVILGVDASFGATPASPVLLQLLDGATVIWQQYITQNFSRQFRRGLNTSGGAVSAVLASGGASVVGEVNLDGVTV